MLDMVTTIEVLTTQVLLGEITIEEFSSEMKVYYDVFGGIN